MKYFIHLSISRHYIKFKLFKLEILSGEAVSYYSIVVNSDSQTLFENFIEENLNLFKSEIRDIISRLISMGKKTGAREIYFKLNEGEIRFSNNSNDLKGDLEFNSYEEEY